MEFNDLLIRNDLKKALSLLNFKTLTPIQEKAIPLAINGIDILGEAPTGTGKTLSFLIPVIEQIDASIDDVQALILTPTRELCTQVCTEFRKVLSYVEGIKTLPIYGGQNIEIQIKGLKNNPKVIVGTPGRIIDHLERKTIKLNNLKFLVLDEADEMLNMGFVDDLNVILKKITSPHQTMLFSATFPSAIKDIARNYLNNPVIVKTLANDLAIPQVLQYYVELLEKNKVDCLSRMLDAYDFKQALIFCRTKKNVDDLSLTLVDRGFKVESLHGDMMQVAREKVMKMFKEGIVKVLIATDVAARGLDIEGIDVVFNYDIPDDVEYYIHRIGRTGRAGRSGVAYTFVNRKEISRIKDFANHLHTPIERITPPSYEEAEYAKLQHLFTNLVENDVDVTKYETFITDFVTYQTNIDITLLCAKLLQHFTKGDSRYQDDGEDITVQVAKKERAKKLLKVTGFTRIFINLGDVDRLKKVDLIDLVKTKRHVNKNDIINVDILRTYSFFDIPDAQVNVVMDMLNKMEYNGREIVCEVASQSKKKTKQLNKKSPNNLKKGRGHKRIK